MNILKNSFTDAINWENPVYKIVPNQINIFDIRISSHSNRLNEFTSLLSPDEIIRANKYFQQKDHERFIVSRGMQRIILGKYLNEPAASLQFKLDQYKKPFLSDCTSEIYFNLSHSADTILLAVSAAPVGADVEYINPDFPYQEIVEDHFTEEEVRYICEEHSSERFFKLWTRKEAFLKATGQGIGDDLKLYPTLDGVHVFNEDTLGHHLDWQQISFKLGENYIGSVASGTGEIVYNFYKPA